MRRQNGGLFVEGGCKSRINSGDVSRRRVIAGDAICNQIAPREQSKEQKQEQERIIASLIDQITGLYPGAAERIILRLCFDMQSD